MAACSELEEKPSSPKEPLPLKIFVENAVNHEMRKNCYNDLKSIHKNHESSPELKEATTDDLKELSEIEFKHLLEEATNFNHPPQPESIILKQLKEEISVLEPKVESDYPYLRANKNSIYESTCIHPTFQRTRKQKHNKSESKNISNALKRNSHQSQSMQDLSSSDSKSKQKSHKSHRTLSLSSEEAIGIVSDSSTNFRTNKKSLKQLSVNNSKSELIKTSKNCSKLNSESVIAVEIEDVNNKELPSCVQSESLPYHLLVNESDIPLPPCIKNSISDKGVSSNPIEIEMEEIKSDKVSTSDGIVFDKEIKTKNGPQQSNSTFYVNAVDSALPITLKNIVPKVPDKKIDGIVSDQKGPLFPPLPIPWNQNYSMHNFINSGTSVFLSRDDKPSLSGDINANPFTRSSITSVVSASILDGNSTEHKNRKNKRTKNSLSKVVLSESIAGYRGKEDIDTLLEYINSSDKKNKVSVKSSQNQLLSNKHMLHEHDKKKTLGKDIKHCHKNMLNSVKKKLTRSNSLENLSAHNDISEEITYSYEAGDTRCESSTKNSRVSNFGNSVSKHLDINSNEETGLVYMNEKGKDCSSTDESGSLITSHSSPEVSSFAADFYSTADVSSQTIEDSGFLIVKKKQRKKQSKRSDSYRWRTAQTQRKKGMMLPLSESKCGKQDSRRKSTSSVPHSEHSSADNSDLDSVHSLPVRGSVPHPTQPHPHTTPSSSSSTPQASYADIARMPISKLNSPATCMITYSAQNPIKQQNKEQEIKKHDNLGSSVPQYKRRLSDSKDPSTFLSKATSRLTISDKEKDSSDDSEVKFRTHAKSTREINTQTDPQCDEISCDHKAETSTSNKKEEIESCNVCLCQKLECCCVKSLLNVRQKTKSIDIPPVIMDNILSESNACNVSFGFGIEEVLQMTPSKSASTSSQAELQNPVSLEKSDIKNAEITKKHEFHANKSAKIDSSNNCSLSKEVSKTILNRDLSREQSSHLKTISYGSGKNICYSETKVNVKKFNLSEIANFLGNEFQSIEKEIKGINKNNKAYSKVMYYVDSADEA